MFRRYLQVLRITVVVSCVLPLLVWIYSLASVGKVRLGAKGPVHDAERVVQYLKAGLSAEGHGLWEWLLFLALMTGCVVAAARILPDRVFPALERLSRQQAGYLDRLPERGVGLAILASAAVSLILELAVIRWQGAVFEMFAFYKNFGLLASFAGLGLGYAMARHEQIPLPLTVPALAWQILLLTITRYGPEGWDPGLLKATPVLEQLNMGVRVAPLRQYGAVLLLLGLTFMLTAMALVPVGQLCGRLLERRPKLSAYGLNLVGSLLGVLLFFGFSFLWTPPVVWFVTGFVLILAFQTFDRRALLAGLISGGIALIVLAWPADPRWTHTHSPYQLLELGPWGPGSDSRAPQTLRAAGTYYQSLLNLSPSHVSASGNEALKRAANYYELPYRIAGQVGDVAIVGAGTGNDVAAALRMGAHTVDAVEIDPAILSFGQAFHPEQPYGDRRVRPIVDDARTHLRTTERSYDMIVYGLLDSHTLLSYASNVRLDSFVYTVEGFQEARDRLKNGGILSLSFSVISPPLGRKIYLMLEKAFDGVAPVSIEAGYDRSVIFLERKGGPMRLPAGLVEAQGFADVTTRYADGAIRADVSTDDWPFFYMPARSYPISYLVVVGLILVLSLGLTRALHRLEPRFDQAVFFLLGAGFLLVETKNITELGLTFGNTWHVIGIAIAGILTMAFIANVVVERFQIRNVVVPYALLLATITVGLIIAWNGGFPSTMLGRLTALIVLSLPLFFSGMVFSTALQHSEDISGALAANLVGAMFGGLLEYNSMYFGFAFLYWVALGLYGAAFLVSLRLHAR